MALLNRPSSPSSSSSSSSSISSTCSAAARLYAILSLVTLAVQNTSLALVLHASRVVPPPDGHGHIGGSGKAHDDRGAYFTPSAVFCTEVAKTVISATLLLLGIARAKRRAHAKPAAPTGITGLLRLLCDTLSPSTIRHACSLVFSETAWPLSFPAILYVLQNNLQYTAAGNLEPAVFQTLYQLKILTTALFSRILLGKRLHRKQWIALTILACGVAIVQVGSQSGHSRPMAHLPPPDALPASAHSHSGIMEEYASLMAEEIADIERRAGIPPPPPPPPMSPNPASPLIGFLAVLAACVTSGLAGVWFEKIVKGGACAAKAAAAAAATANPNASPSPHRHRSDSNEPRGLSTLPTHAASSLSRSRSPIPLKSHEDERHARSGSSGSTNGSERYSHEEEEKGRGKLIDGRRSGADPSALDLSTCTVWLSALQLSLFSLAPALVPVLVKMYAESPSPAADAATSPSPYPDIYAPWRNFGAWAWTIVALQTVGGLVTALVVRWADNILKCFAVALALLMTSILSIPLFAFELTTSFCVGAGLTLAATVLYQRAGEPLVQHEATATAAAGDDHARPHTSILFDRKEDDREDEDDDDDAIALLPTSTSKRHDMA